MSTHYTPDHVSLVRLIRWKRLIFELLIPLSLVLSAISAWVDDVPYRYYVIGVAWAYIVSLAGIRWGGAKALQAHALISGIIFFVSGMNGIITDAPVVALSSHLMAALLFGAVASIAQSHYRIDKLVAPGASGRSADFPGIYRITCIPNGKQYIGQTSQAINARWSEHRAHLSSGRHHNRWLQADWDIYRSEQFKWEVLEVVTDPVWLLDRERAWQDLDYDAAKRYNPPNLAPRIVKASRRPPMKRKR